jgi:hypothetical protein
MRQFAFLIAASSFAFILLGIGTFYIVRARRRSVRGWRMLMDRLRQVDRESVALVALDLLDDHDPSEQLDPDRIFQLIGGMEGLSALEENCEVLIDLATYVQRWYPDALALGEELRLNAREIQWHIGRLRGAARAGHLQDQFATYAQRAVATYYLMTRSILVLYQGVERPEFAELQRAL